MQTLPLNAVAVILHGACVSGSLSLPTSAPFHRVAMRQLAAVGPSDKVAPGMEVCVEQRCGTELLRAEKVAPTDLH